MNLLFIYKGVNMATLAEQVCANDPARIEQILKYKFGYPLPLAPTPSDLRDAVYDIAEANTKVPSKPLSGWNYIANRLFNWWTFNPLGPPGDLAVNGPKVADLQKTLHQSSTVIDSIYTGP